MVPIKMSIKIDAQYYASYNTAQNYTMQPKINGGIHVSSYPHDPRRYQSNV